MVATHFVAIQTQTMMARLINFFYFNRNSLEKGASSCICPDFNDKIQALYLRVKRLWFPSIHEQDIT
jgi:hypothetical protein